MNTNLSEVIIAGSIYNDQKIEPVLSEPDARRMQRETSQKPAEHHVLDAMSRRSGEESMGIVSIEERRGDDGIIAAIAHALEWNRLTPRNIIDAEVRGGHVILAGSVCAYEDREAAAMVVKQVRGVCDIDNHIEVLKDDILSNRLKSAIVDALLRRARRMYEQIGVEMKGGRVVLTGKVASIAEKRLVLDTLGWIHHVQAIEDRLEVIRDHP